MRKIFAAVLFSIFLLPANVSLQVEMGVTTACFRVHYEMLLICCILQVDIGNKQEKTL